MTTLTIPEIGSGSLANLTGALARAGVKYALTPDPQEIAQAQGLLLPNPVSAAESWQRLEEMQLTSPLRGAIRRGCPTVVLGSAIDLLRGGKGLGLLDLQPPAAGNEPGVTSRGWLRVTAYREHLLFQSIPEASFFYFPASELGEPASEGEVLARIGGVDEGGPWAVFATATMACVRFQPGKSSDLGMRFLANIGAWVDDVTDRTSQPPTGTEESSPPRESNGEAPAQG